jgi:hypothetical protein
VQPARFAAGSTLRVKALAGIGDADPARGAMGQSDVDRPLDQADVFGDRRRRETKLAGGRRETLSLHHRYKQRSERMLALFSIMLGREAATDYSLPTFRE